MSLQRKMRGDSMAKVNITMQDELLAWVDAYAEDNFTSRSGAITMMVAQYKASREMAATIKELNAAIQKLALLENVTEEEKLQLLAFEQLAKSLPVM